MVNKYNFYYGYYLLILINYCILLARFKAIIVANNKTRKIS